ncbi:MAG: DUF4124 domain-containing protein [Rhodocyclaceae bacterium]|nr:DUF4124 domain-containing protein [Rhodocyclaceae bacterium]
MPPAHRYATLLPAFFLAGSALAQVYSWKDESGKIHYGDRPPAQREARKVAPAPPPTSDGEAARKAAAEKKLAEQEKKAAQEKPAEDPSQARLREENCRAAKANLAGLESGQIRFRMNEQGEREALDGPVREAELSRAKKAVAEWCSPPKPASTAAGK